MCVTFSLIFSLFLLIHTSNGYDITQILNKYSDFSTFNSYLTQTNLANTMNSHNTITVLVVDNANLAPLSSKSLEVIKNILSVHVLLDYYDITKLQQLTSTSPLLTTLFQTTGLAVGQQGFLNVTHPSTDTVAFGSAMPGSTQGSSLVKSIASEPYNISILQISNAIIPQGIDGAKTSAPPSKAPSATTPPPPTPATTTPPPPAPTTATTTAPPKAAAIETPPPPAPATATAPTKSSQVQPPSTTAPPTPSQAMTPPTSSPPTKVAAPTKAAAPTMTATPSAAPGSASAPAASTPGASTEDTPATDEPAASKPTAKGATTSLEIGVVVVCTMALSTLYLASTI